MALSMSSGFALGWIIAEMRGSRRRDVPRKTYPSEQQPQSWTSRRLVGAGTVANR